MATQLGASDISATPYDGGRISTATVDGSSLARGIAEIGGALQMRDRELDAEADREAEVIQTEAMAKYAPARAERAAGEAGQQSDYSRIETEAFDAHTAEYRQMAIDPRVQKMLNRRLDAQRVQLTQSAIEHTALVQGRRAETVRTLKENAEDLNAYLPIFQAGQAAVREQRNGWNGVDAGLTDATAQAWDAVTAPMLEAVPEAQRPRVAVMLANRRNDLLGGAIDAETKGQTAFLLRTASDTADTAAKMVLADPGERDAALKLVDDAALLVDGELKEKFRRDGRGEVVSSYFSALISGGQIDQAENELAAYIGSADLSPEMYGRVQAMIGRGREQKRASDYAGQAAMDSRVTAYYDALVAGDPDAAGLRPGDEEVRGLLGDKGLFEFRQSETAYKEARLKLGDVASLSGAQLDERVAQLQAEAEGSAGKPDYALRKNIAQAAVTARDAQKKARQADPAAWAMAGDGSANDPGQRGRYFWTAIQSEQDPKKRALAMRTYADWSLARQRDAGIQSPTLLPADTAKGMIKAVADAPEAQRGRAFIGLVAQVSQWGNHRGQVLNELKRAGLGGPDAVVAAEFNADPLAQQAFVQGGIVVQKMKPKEKDGLLQAVGKQLAAFDNTSVGPGASAQMRADRQGAIARIAAGYMANGDDQAHAVQRATAQYRDQYDFVGTYRVPKSVSGQRPESAGFLARAGGDRRATKGEAIKDATLTIRNALAGVDASNMQGEGLSRLSDNQAEARAIAASIRAAGRWVTLPDESGLALMIPDDVTGSWTVVRDKAGAPIAYDWDSLEAAGNAAYAAGAKAFDERRAGVRPVMMEAR